MKELFRLYNSSIKPAYEYLVALTEKKPVQVVVEIENTFAHLASIEDFSPENLSTDKNYEKAINHLNRLALDVHKLLCAELHQMFVSKSEKIFIDFVGKVRIARRLEMSTIGHDNVLATVEKYRDAIETACKSLGLPKLS